MRVVSVINISPRLSIKHEVTENIFLALNYKFLIIAMKETAK